MEIQSLQTREYKASKQLVFSTIVSVFQGLGYTILTADPQTGLLRAKSLRQMNCQFTITAFIEPVGNMARTRLSCVKTNFGEDLQHEKYKEERQVLNLKFYQNIFERIDSGLAVRQNN